MGNKARKRATNRIKISKPVGALISNSGSCVIIIKSSTNMQIIQTRKYIAVFDIANKFIGADVLLDRALLLRLECQHEFCIYLTISGGIT